MTDEASPSNGSDDQNGQPASSTRHRTRRGESKGLSGAPAWMTGEIPRVDDRPAAAKSSGQAGDEERRPNIVRHVDRPTQQSDRPTRQPDRPAPAERAVKQPAPGVRGDQVAGQSEPAATGGDTASVAAENSEDDNAAAVRARAVPAWHTDLDEADAAERASAAASEDSERMPRRRSGKRSWALIAAAVLVVAALGAGGYLVADRFGLLVSSKDFSSQTGDADVLVTIPDNSTLTDFGRILSDSGVVGSSKAFVSAANNQPLAGGIYKLRTGISAATAVEMMSGETHRVGRLVVPEGVQLEAKRGVDRKTVPGVFDRIETATSIDLNGEKIGITVEQLENAAKTASADELGIPTWAREAFADLAGDYRRVEGLVAPGTWEAIDPQATPVEILRQLITDSSRRYESWGLLSANKSGLKPYEVLVAASVAEREVNSVDDLPKVARVILNRLDKKQRLEMDSTTNYTAAETNIDVHGENYKADTRWNTYRVFGLPPTPIATVGEKAMKAMLDPPEGNWLYFITVDKQGTTKFSATFKEHLRNRKIACDNKFLRTGC